MVSDEQHSGYVFRNAARHEGLSDVMCSDVISSGLLMFKDDCQWWLFSATPVLHTLSSLLQLGPYCQTDAGLYYLL